MKKISHAVKEGVYPQVSLGLMPISFHVAPAPTGMCSTYTQSQLQEEPPESSHGHPSKQRFLALALHAVQSDLEFTVSSTKPYKVKNVQVV